MKEIGTISLGRLNNGAHFLYVSNVLARAEADGKVSTKAATQIAALKAAVAQEDKETGLLVNFIADLEGKYATQVAALSLTPFVTNLKEANERVRTLTADRTEERMAVSVGALKQSRKAADDAYRTLVKWVNALALIEGETEYADFIDYVNTEITHYKREVIGQKADPAGTSGGGDTPDKPVTPPGEGSGDGSDDGEL